MNIKPIETVYNGYRFRSRLEAKWAVFFDAAGIKYQYEPEGFELEDGTRYLPDFYLPELDTHCEVKANTKDAIKDIVRYASMIVWGGPIKRLVLLSDIPGECKDGGLWHFPVLHYQDCGCAALDERKNTIVVSWFFFYNDSDATGETKTYGAISSASYPRPFSVGNGKLYGKDGFSLAAKTDTELHRMKNKNYDPFPGDINDLVFDSLRKARQARFEHGEAPGRPLLVNNQHRIQSIQPRYEPPMFDSSEEEVISCLIQNDVDARDLISIKPKDFNSPVLGRIYDILRRRICCGISVRIGALESFLDADEINILAQIIDRCPCNNTNDALEKFKQKKKLEEADIDNDTLMQALAMQRQKQKPEIGRLFNWEDVL